MTSEFQQPNKNTEIFCTAENLHEINKGLSDIGSRFSQLVEAYCQDMDKLADKNDLLIDAMNYRIIKDLIHRNHNVVFGYCGPDEECKTGTYEFGRLIPDKKDSDQDDITLTLGKVETADTFDDLLQIINKDFLTTEDEENELLILLSLEA